MTTFLRLLADKDKASNLLASCSALRAGESDARVFQVAPESFRAVPGAPFAYWVSAQIRSVFATLPPFENGERKSSGGIGSTDDFRFIRSWWERPTQWHTTTHDEATARVSAWIPIAQGGSYAPFYAQTPSVIQYGRDGLQLKTLIEEKLGSASRNVRAQAYYFRAGLTWPLRGHTFSSWPLPEGSVFSVAGKAACAPRNELLFWLAVFNSKAFDYLIRLFAGKVGGVQYESGLVGQLPVPKAHASEQLSVLARRAWSLKRTCDTIEETSHAFLLPAALRERLGNYNPPTIEAELTRIQAEIDAIAFDLYGFTVADRAAVHTSRGVASGGEAEAGDEQHTEDGDDKNSAAPIDHAAGLLSWAVGVAFGRFDWRLATGERAAPIAPEPFDPLPAKSPGMLPDDATAFHAHAGILVDDPGHPHDLARVVEEVLVHVDAPVPGDVRRWLQREFFAFHLQRYSKSRKAPIYWPLSTTSSGYRLWVYFPSLSSQTLYTAMNDFVDPKLKQVGDDVSALRNKGAARSGDDEKEFEALQAFELELIELRDALFRFAPSYRPNHDDGVQISAAPLWPLFRHKPWQKVLKDTWAKLEKGDYDWSHLAMNYWPERVREKCGTDKSLAIAHGLESLYVEPKDVQKKGRGKRKAIDA